MKLRQRPWEGVDTYLFWCPGCEEAHIFTVRTDGGRPAWSFDGNMQSPTFSPSLLYPDKKPLCHLFLRDGRIEFLGDCGHALAGKTVPLPDLPPEWLDG